MARYDRVIRGGMIVDGSRFPRFRGDIGIKDGLIAEIGHIGAGEAAEAIDAGGPLSATRKCAVFSELDLRKARIGVANTWIEIGPWNLHLRTLAEDVKKGVRAA